MEKKNTKGFTKFSFLYSFFFSYSWNPSLSFETHGDCWSIKMQGRCKRKNHFAVVKTLEPLGWMNKEGTIKVIFIVKEALQMILSISFYIPKYLRSSSKPDGQWSSRVKYCGVVSFLCYPLQILSSKKVTSVEYAVKKNMLVFT